MAEPVLPADEDAGPVEGSPSEIIDELRAKVDHLTQQRDLFRDAHAEAQKTFVWLDDVATLARQCPEGTQVTITIPDHLAAKRLDQLEHDLHQAGVQRETHRQVTADAKREVEHLRATVAERQIVLDQNRAYFAELTDLRAIVARLKAESQNAERQLGEEVDRRDHAEEWADRLAHAIADQREIGEHSNANAPWANAEEVAQSFGMDMALAERLRTTSATVARLRTAAHDLLADIDYRYETDGDCPVCRPPDSPGLGHTDRCHIPALRAALDDTTAEEPEPAVERERVRVELTSDELDGGYVAECVSLPGCLSQGDTVPEALVNLADAYAAIKGGVAAEPNEEPKR